jgi:hydroxymethylpyrimidine/phosphomethylpyrimidine kinase
MQIALTIAGSDSGGGAGIQADLKTFQRFGVYGTSVVTAVTAQNTRGVRAVHPVPTGMVGAQLEALAGDLPPAACKTGMLATAGIVHEVAAGIIRHDFANFVLDPVLQAGSGDALLEPDAEQAMREELLPLATLVTPNLGEAARLTGLAVTDPGTMARAGERLLEMGAAAALVKGGHLAGEELVDVLITRDGARELRHRRIARQTHGTGCTLSAAITAGLALGQPLPTAVATAIEYVQHAIARAPDLGTGRSPLQHGV